MTTPSTGLQPSEMTDRYLELLARTLTRFRMDSPYRQADPTRLKPVPRAAWNLVQRVLQRGNLTMVRHIEWDYDLREDGRDWPADGETMVGLKRLENLRSCLEQVIADGIPGDVLEAGVWRGGASIFMCGVLTAHGDRDRGVWVADSFEGLPPASADSYPADGAIAFETFRYLAVSLEEVRANFEKYGLLDDRVHFVKGWFKDTMPQVPAEELCLLRLDGDMYESTIQVLDAMYDRVVPGGFVVVDDYNALPECKQAVTDFRTSQGIEDEILAIDWAGVYWRKS